VTEVASKVYPADPEHGGLRFAFVLAFLGGGVVGFVVVNALVNAASAFNVGGIIGGLIGAIVFTQVVDRAIRPRWPSGRVVEIDAQGARTKQQQTVQVDLKSSTPSTLLFWRFEIDKKRQRIEKGWWMLACAVEQADAVLSVYTFMSPKAFQELTDHARFVALTKPKDDKESDLRLAGKQRRLRLAEEGRWQGGAELNAEDFLAFVQSAVSTFKVPANSDDL
jgi:uncharacterized membrane protein YeaQ/YmgE (transglycosylase-associated protein family)